jgi:hypothetical protein
MKPAILLLLFFILSNHLFCQSLREKNKELEVEYDSQKEIATSFFSQQMVLNVSVSKSRHENRMFMLDLLALYSDTEEKKVEFHELINETNDTLIDWSKFYRYEDVSFNQLKTYQDNVLESYREDILLMPLEMDFSAGERRNPKEWNAFLTKEIAFFREVIPPLKKIITQMENQLAAQESTRLKLLLWKEIIEKTRNYCLGKSGSIPFKVSEIKLELCGTAFTEQILADTLFKKEIVKDEFFKIPEFPGGFTVMQSYLDEQFIRAYIRLENRSDSKNVYAKFIVTDNGEILNPVITRAPDCFQCNKAVLKIIQNMPGWLPATKGGNPVSFVYRLQFKIN